MLEMAVSRHFIDMAIMINGQVERLLQATKMKIISRSGLKYQQNKQFQLKLSLTFAFLLNICFPLKYLKLMEKFHNNFGLPMSSERNKKTEL